LKLRYLLDTHVFVRWVSEPRRLSREQARVLRNAQASFQHVGLATISILEMALLAGGPRSPLEGRIEDLLAALRQHESVKLLPITIEVAQEVASVGDALRDPMDRAIVATARVHGLTLLTSDERIVDSKLVPVID
jgi:PIN domain nuclease of toxin-antitoxin system